MIQAGCYADQICIAVMMVINLKHLDSSRTEALPLLPCVKLLHNASHCSPGNVMTARQAVDGEVHMEKYYLCERSIKRGARGDGTPIFYICCLKNNTEVCFCC